jgi:hypothetical protein
MGGVRARNETMNKIGFRYKSTCRACRQITLTTSREWYRASPPRCSTCGGMLDKGARASGWRSRRKKKPPSAKSATEAILPVIKRSAQRAGIEVDWRLVGSFGRKRQRRILHVWFNRGAERIADYWPSNGTLRVNGVNTMVTDVAGALDVAKMLIGAEIVR